MDCLDTSHCLSRLFRSLAALTALLACGVAVQAHEQTVSRAHYLGNEGVMVAHGATKILFDPLFRQDYGQYRLVPAEMEAALMAGEPPWDGVDAVFISHFHDDHFDPELMLAYLESNTSVRLYAPAQAVEELRAVGEAWGATVFDRVFPIELAYGDAPVRIDLDNLVIEAVRIPHAGWPDRRTDVENIAFRVTLDDVTTVTHLGDADTAEAHFAADYWGLRHTHLAMPPYWFFGTPESRAILEETIGADHAVGIHVPTNIPADPGDRSAPLNDVDLFTRPGETREIPE